MEFLEGAIIASQSAGEFLLRHVNDTKEVKNKNSIFDFVTKFDKMSEDIFFNILQIYFPDIPFLSEESGRMEGEHVDKDRYWILDPLDGTSNYVRGIPIFCTSLALIENEKPILGVIYDPSRKELFWAEAGKGSYLNGKRIYVSQHKGLEGAVLATTFSYELSLREKNAPYFTNFYKVVQSIRNLGSSALSLSYVAAGRLDAYWTFSVSVWDIAAGALIVEEAGGKYSFISRKIDKYSELSGTIEHLSANMHIFDILQHKLSS